MPPGHFFSHATAAALHGLPLPARLELDRTLHVSANRPDRPPRMRGVTGHWAGHDGNIADVNGFPATSALGVWCQVARRLSLDETIILGDALVRRQNPPATMADLRAAVLAMKGSRGVGVLSRALAEIRPGVDSPKESEIRLMLVRSGLPEARVNLPIRNEHGAQVALGDLVYPDHRVLIEYDGRIHFGDEATMIRDIDRADNVMEQGWRVIRLNKSHRPVVVVSKVMRALMDSGWRPDRP